MRGIAPFLNSIDALMTGFGRSARFCWFWWCSEQYLDAQLPLAGKAIVSYHLPAIWCTLRPWNSCRNERQVSNASSPRCVTRAREWSRRHAFRRLLARAVSISVEISTFARYLERHDASVHYDDDYHHPGFPGADGRDLTRRSATRFRVAWRYLPKSRILANAASSAGLPVSWASSSRGRTDIPPAMQRMR